VDPGSPYRSAPWAAEAHSSGIRQIACRDLGLEAMAAVAAVIVGVDVVLFARRDVR
jgi:hypothetical protein